MYHNLINIFANMILLSDWVPANTEYDFNPSDDGAFQFKEDSQTSSQPFYMFAKVWLTGGNTNLEIEFAVIDGQFATYLSSCDDTDK